MTSAIQGKIEFILIPKVMYILVPQRLGDLFFQLETYTFCPYLKFGITLHCYNILDEIMLKDHPSVKNANNIPIVWGGVELVWLIFMEILPVLNQIVVDLI